MTRKLILRLALLLILLVAALEVFSRLYLSQLIQPTVRREISEATGCRAELEKARLSIFGGLLISNLSLSDNDGNAILSAKRVRLVPRILPLLFLRFDVRVANVVAPVITIAKSDTGKWNTAGLVSHLSKQSGTKTPPPSRIELEDGSLAIKYDPGAETETAVGKINMSLIFTPEGKASYSGNILVLATEKSGLTVSGTYDPLVGQNKISVVGHSIRVSPYSTLIKDISGIPLAERAGVLDFDLDIHMESGKEIKGQGTTTWKDIHISDDSLSFSGDLSMEGSFYTDTKSRPLYRGTVKVSSSTLDLKELPHELTDVNGLILISDNMMSTTAFAVKYRGYDVEMMGNLTNFHSPELDLRVRSTVGIKEILELCDMHDEIAEADTLSGTAKMELFLRGEILSADGLSITGDFAIQDGEIKSQGMPALKEINGVVYLISDALIFKNLQGTFKDNRISVKGNVSLTAEPQVDLAVSSTDSLISLKGTIGQDVLHLKSLNGNFGTSTFTISGTVRDFDNPDLDLECRGKINLTSMAQNIPEGYTKQFFGMDLLPKGSLRIDGSIAGRPSSPKELSMNIKGTSDSLQFGTWFLNGVDFSANMKDRIITVDNFKGIVNQGEINASGAVDIAQDMTEVSLSCSASGVNFSKKMAGSAEEEIYGTLSGEIKVEGFPANPPSLSGSGVISIERGKIWELRFFQGLLNILSVAYPGTGNIMFNRIGGTFTLQDGYIESDDLILDSSSMKLYPKGRLGLDGTLDCTINVDIFDTKGNIIKKITRTIMNIPGQFMGVKLTGTLQNPQWRPIMIPFIKGLKKTGKRGSDLFLDTLPKKKD